MQEKPEEGKTTYGTGLPFASTSHPRGQLNHQLTLGTQAGDRGSANIWLEACCETGLCTHTFPSFLLFSSPPSFTPRDFWNSLLDTGWNMSARWVESPFPDLGNLEPCVHPPGQPEPCSQQPELGLSPPLA